MSNKNWCVLSSRLYLVVIKYATDIVDLSVCDLYFLYIDLY